MMLRIDQTAAIRAKCAVSCADVMLILLSLGSRWFAFAFHESLKETFKASHAFAQVGNLISQIAVQGPQEAKNGDKPGKCDPVGWDTDADSPLLMSLTGTATASIATALAASRCDSRIVHLSVP